MDNLGTNIMIGMVKAVVCVYDVVTFPFYFVLQRPWEQWCSSSLAWAKPLKEGDPASPYVRIIRHKDTNNPLEGVTTLNELFRKVTAMHNHRPLLGAREVFAEEQEIQPDGKVFRKLVLGEYKWLSGAEADARVEQVARGLMAVGLRTHQKVVIFSETRLEWMLTAQACFRNNMPIVTIYATLGDDGVLHGINETEATHVITTYDLIPKMKNIIGQMPSVTHIIYMEGPKQPVTTGFPDLVKVIPFSQMESMGANLDAAICAEAPRPDDIAVIMYTSGSTGVPKGVLITHKNILATIIGFQSAAPLQTPADTFMAYLPLAHVLELAGEYFFMSNGVPIGYSSPHTMTDKSTAIKKGCPGDASLLKPTVITAVPLVLDRIRKNVLDVVEAKGKFSKALFKYAISYKKFWTHKGFSTPVADRLVFKQIKKLVGGRLKLIATGGAALSPDTHDFIRACLNCTVAQGYGLTETAASATLMDLYDWSSGRVGPPLGGNCYLRLVDWDEGGYHVTDQPCPRGEIVIGGDAVTLGYYKNEPLTKESFKVDGGIRWFYTGDIGEIHSDGSFKIIDRKKDLIKLQFGEYISLGKVETELKTCPVIDNICVFGNSFQTYLVALVVPNPKHLKMLAEELGKGDLTFMELCKDMEVQRAVTKMLFDHGKKCRLQRSEIPTKVKLCTEDWQPDSGLVTAAFKLRRKAIEAFYRREINGLYGLDSNNSPKST